MSYFSLSGLVAPSEQMLNFFVEDLERLLNIPKNLGLIFMVLIAYQVVFNF